METVNLRRTDWQNLGALCALGAMLSAVLEYNTLTFLDRR